MTFMVFLSKEVYCLLFHVFTYFSSESQLIYLSIGSPGGHSGN
jgi:hypothetical protein